VTAYQAKVEDLIFSAQKNTVSTITPQTGGTVDDVHRAMLVYTEQDAVSDEDVNLEYYAAMYHAAINSLEQLKGLHHHCYMYPIVTIQGLLYNITVIMTAVHAAM